MNAFPSHSFSRLFASTSFFLCACYHPTFALSTSSTSDGSLTTSSSETDNEPSVTLGDTDSANSLTSPNTTDSSPLCGNGEIDLDEQCDHGADNSNSAACTKACKHNVCGDDLTWAGEEECDDGNTIDDDLCSNACILATCTDKIKNGNESDLDCGGGCPGCGLGHLCSDNLDCTQEHVSICDQGTCAYPPNCKKILEVDSEKLNKNTFYRIDPDGNGGNDFFSAYCDMTTDGGGWTLLSWEDFNFFFETDSWKLKGNPYNQITTCGNFEPILGGYNILGAGDYITKEVDLKNISHDTVRLRADFIAIDAWDGEEDSDHAYATIDGVNVRYKFCDADPADYAMDEIYQCNQVANKCGNNSMNDLGDAQIILDVVKAHNLNEVTVGIGSNLNESKEYESWGIDNVAVYVR